MSALAGDSQMRSRSLLYILVSTTFLAAVAAWMLALPTANYQQPWGTLWKLMDSAYFSAQLFGGGFSDYALHPRVIPTPGAPVVPADPTDPQLALLAVIRFVAFALGIFLALLAIVAGFRARVFAWGRRWRAREFDLVIGYGQVGRGLATALARAQGRSGRVVAVSRAPGQFDQREARREGIELYAGDARELAMTRRLPAAPLAAARRIFVAAGSDTETLAVARELAATLPTRADRIWMNFSDPMLLERLRDLPNPSGRPLTPRPQAFSMAEATAEYLVTRYRPMLTARACGHARMHAVVIGFDQSTWPVIEQLILNGTYPPPSYARARLTIVDADAERARARWQARHGDLARWADVDFIAADPAAIAWARDDAILRAIEDLDPPSLYVFARNLQALPSALGLHHGMTKGERAAARIFVISNTRTDEVLRFGESAADLQDDVVLIGDPVQVASVGVACNAAITDLATEIHRGFAPDQPFANLSETLRVSNRRAAIHALDKLALMGFEQVDAVKSGFGLSQAAASRIAALIAEPGEEALDAVAGFEHVRWCIDRTLDGWRSGPRDDAARRRDQLEFGAARYAELSQMERAKDRDQVETVVKWVQHCGVPSAAPPLRIVTRAGPAARWAWQNRTLALDLVAPPDATLLLAEPGEACRLTILVPPEPPLAPGEGANARGTARRAAYAAFATALTQRHPGVHFRLLRARAEGHDWLGTVPADLPVDGATLPPLTLGFAGPRAFSPTPEISARIEEIVARHVSGDRPVRLVTGMAMGADALMIKLCHGKMRILGVATDAVTEEDPQRLLVDHVDEGARTARDTDIHTAVARRIIASCDVLIAVDDGSPAGGPGGTADTIAQARALVRPVEIVTL